MQKNDTVTETYNPTYLNFTVPAGWPTPPTNIFANNPLTEEGFQLGKKLFYDGKLSKDGNFPAPAVTSSLPPLPLSTTTLAMALIILYHPQCTRVI